jgi:hypothetical protein
MRIQETDRILKEARYTRQPVQREGVLMRAWHKLTGIFRKH